EQVGQPVEVARYRHRDRRCPRRRVGRSGGDGRELGAGVADLLVQLEEEVGHVHSHRHRLRQLVEVGGANGRLLRLRERRAVRRGGARLLDLDLRRGGGAGDALRGRALGADEHEPAEDEEQDVAADDGRDRAAAGALELRLHQPEVVVVSVGVVGTGAGAATGGPATDALIEKVTPPALEGVLLPPLEPESVLEAPVLTGPSATFERSGTSWSRDRSRATLS